MIYVNKIENRITFKIKTRCYLELLMPETMKLLGSTKSKISKDKNGESVPHLEVISGNCNINNNNQHDSQFLFTFITNKSLGQLLDILRKNFNFIFLFSYIKVWFPDQNSTLLELEHKINMTLVIN